MTAEEARQKAESEYHSLRSGMKSMAEGWKADLDWLRADLVKLEAKHQRDLDEAKLKHTARSFSHLFRFQRTSLTLLLCAVADQYKAKEAEHVDVKMTIGVIQVALKQTERSIAELTERFESGVGAITKDDDALRRCQELEGEFRRMRRLMREHT